MDERPAFHSWLAVFFCTYIPSRFCGEVDRGYIGLRAVVLYQITNAGHRNYNAGLTGLQTPRGCTPGYKHAAPDGADLSDGA